MPLVAAAYDLHWVDTLRTYRRVRPGEQIHVTQDALLGEYAWTYESDPALAVIETFDRSRWFYVPFECLYFDFARDKEYKK